MISRPLKANERIVNYLTEDNRLDDDIYTMVHQVRTESTLNTLALPEEIKLRFHDFIQYSHEAIPENFLFAFYGPYGPEMVDVAAAICQEIGAPLLLADLEAIFQANIYFERAIDLIFRESKINWAAVYFKNCDFLFDENNGNDYLKRYFLDQIDENSLLTFIASRNQLPLYGEFKKQKLIAIELPLPDYEARKEIWTQNLAALKTEKNLDIKEIAGKYNLSTNQIKEVISTASVYALWRNPAAPVIRPKDIEEATHVHSNQRLGRLAQRIRPKHRWKDIVLEKNIMEKLHELVKMFRHKHIVYNEWQFSNKLSLGKGISALFFGEPGTGKTLAAEIIAAELGMDLYKIDISTIISKYIGETEKNLSRIFDEAEQANAILFFDEADAVFGKRTEVKDSHDRYSNIEVSYLLQRIDEYNGVVIMATNFSQNIDTAFERRLHYSINFPMPDKQSRLEIWKNIFPQAVPKADIDFSLLAEKLEISGGYIKNIALKAAFYAADNQESKEITMEQIKKACSAEYAKMGRLWNDKTLEYSKK
ncbi:MAG: ATP-binding protein [Spirochaetales bacterium]|nr:ATP-binding protein [Spirochaetales bacterium]